MATGNSHLGASPTEKPLDVTLVTLEIGAVPPPDFVSCTTGTITIPPGRISGTETDPATCGAAGYFYAMFTFKGKASGVRAFCQVPEDPAQRVEAR